MSDVVGLALVAAILIGVRAYYVGKALEAQMPQVPPPVSSFVYIVCGQCNEPFLFHPTILQETKCPECGYPWGKFVSELRAFASTEQSRDVLAWVEEKEKTSGQ